MWAIMKAYKFSSLSVNGIELTSPIDGPQRFIPIFETRDQAVKFTNGDETYVAEAEEMDSLASNLPQIPSSLPGTLNAIPKDRKRYIRR